MFVEKKMPLFHLILTNSNRNLEVLSTRNRMYNNMNVLIKKLVWMYNIDKIYTNTNIKDLALIFSTLFSIIYTLY